MVLSSLIQDIPIGNTLSFSFSMIDSHEENHFHEIEFSQWLVLNHHAENECLAQTYFQQLIDNGKMICVKNNPTDPSENIYTFSN